MANAYLFSFKDLNLSIPINDFITIGSSSNNQIYIEEAESRHCRVALENGNYIVRDLNTKQGTYVNGTRIQQAFLQAGDRLYIGNQCYLFTDTCTADKYKTLIKSKNMNWQRKLDQLSNLARTELPILILGESGSGKEVIARQIHKLSNRSKEPFISVNCSALSESLIESELFGHKKGSFTGAECDRQGAFVAANGGTLFLDEIGDLPLSLQPKLLRAIENQEVKPVGSDKPLKIDVRILTATHKHLDQNVKLKKFREDLFFRINTLMVNVPSLRQRKEDIETFVYHFCKQYKVRLTHSAIQLLEQQPWPGNIRELKNVIARASAHFKYQEVDEVKISTLINPIESSDDFEHQFLDQEMPPLKQIEKQLILQHLKKYKGNQKRVAEDLKIPPSTLNDRIKNYKINVREFRA